MYAEAHRPTFVEDVIGHTEIKKTIQDYLEQPKFTKAVVLIGSPGIGKTTLALCCARSFGFDPLEINASRAIRSFDDVDILRDACRSSVNIHSFMLGNRTKKTCVILDEIDGSDPHAQARIVDWICDSERTVPILCTGNEVPTIFKRNTEHIVILRCFPPKATELQHLFPNEDATQLLKICQHDVRRIFHKLQYGESYTIPSFTLPPTGTSTEKAFVWRQGVFGLQDPLECLYDKLGNERLIETKFECKLDDTHGNNHAKTPRQKTLSPDKQNKSSDSQKKSCISVTRC
jgi:hypothetical protein